MGPTPESEARSSAGEDAAAARDDDASARPARPAAEPTRVDFGVVGAVIAMTKAHGLEQGRVVPPMGVTRFKIRTPVRRNYIGVVLEARF